MKTAGFINTQLRVLTAYLQKIDDENRKRVFGAFTDKVKDLLKPYMEHPEATLHNSDAQKIVKVLYKPAQKRKKP
jgi:hypothetical protein